MRCCRLRSTDYSTLLGKDESHVVRQYLAPGVWNVELTGRIRNSPFTVDFVTSRISDKGILLMVFLAGHHGCCGMGDNTIPFLDENGRILANKVQVLPSTT